MASPNSAILMSDMDLVPSSPAGYPEKSFMSVAPEDDDMGTNTKMLAATPEPAGAEKYPRGKKRARGGIPAGFPPGLVLGSTAAAGDVTGKIRHLKKDDGEPLWRKDIQYDFLKAVFDDEKKVFINSYEPDKIGKQCFADLYIDTMSRSSKTSKVLRDKLLSDRDAAKGMAMVCLLVNIGRMNTTLNFFPEMRAQLRTYHAIPSLQIHQDPHAYKALQDAPRLKSILKGGMEDRPEPTSLDELKANRIPRTNPVNMLFLVNNAASKIAELHFPPRREFHDLIMKTNLSSVSRARAFLWLVWFYLESDFTEEGCEENPFGAGVDYGLDVANQGVPRLAEMTADEEAAENVDPPEELEFGREKQKLRARIIDADQQLIVDSQGKQRIGRGPKGAPGAGIGAGVDVGEILIPGILPRIRPTKHEPPGSDLDSIRSTPPPRVLTGARHLQNGGGLSTGAGRIRGHNPLKYQIYEGASSPAPSHGQGGSHKDLGNGLDGVVSSRKPRPPTAHQLAVERNRSQRVEYILDRGIRRSHHKSRKHRRYEGAILRALRRLAQVQDPFEDSEEEAERHLMHLYRQQNARAYSAAAAAAANAAAAHLASLPFREPGYAGLCQLKTEVDDFGEEFAAYSGALRRADRRLMRWEASKQAGEKLGVIRPIKRPRPPRKEDDGELDGDENKDEEGLDDEDDATMLFPSHRKSHHYDLSMMGGDDEDSLMMDPAETEDDVEISTIQAGEAYNTPATSKTSSRKQTGGGSKPAAPRRSKANGARGKDATSRRKETNAGGSGKKGSAAPKANGRRQLLVADTGSEVLDEADELDDVDKELLGLADGEDENEGDGLVVAAGYKDRAADVGVRDSDNGEELDDLDKTLLGLEDSDSE